MIRKKIREIDSAFHCSIIGTCLSVDEVRKLLELVYMEDFGCCSDYILHGMAVGGAGEFSRFSNKLTELLNRKYRINVHKASAVDDYYKLKSYWEESVSDGDIAGPYWAVLSHPECSEDLRNLAFGENKSLKEENERLSERIKVLADRPDGNRAAVVRGSRDDAEKYRRKLRMAEQRNSSLELRLSEAAEEISSLREYTELVSGLLKSAGRPSAVCGGGKQKIVMLKNSGLSSFARDLRKAV